MASNVVNGCQCHKRLWISTQWSGIDSALDSAMAIKNPPCRGARSKAPPGVRYSANKKLRRFAKLRGALAERKADKLVA